MAFTGRDTNDRMRDDFIFQVCQPTVVANTNTVLEYSIGPWELVNLVFEMHHCIDIVECHRPECEFVFSHSFNI
jgi:hypothetical protein